MEEKFVATKTTRAGGYVSVEACERERVCSLCVYVCVCVCMCTYVYVYR